MNGKRSADRLLYELHGAVDSLNMLRLGHYRFEEVTDQVLPFGLTYGEVHTKEGIASIRHGANGRTRAYLRDIRVKDARARDVSGCVHLLYEPGLPADLQVSKSDFIQGFQDMAGGLKPLF